jgi:membrane-bound inhibitor of C-type lysozyme
MEKVNCLAGLHLMTDRRLDVGSTEWMTLVSRILGVFDTQGHGPDPGSKEWKRAIHRKAFDKESRCIRGITYLSDTGTKLHATYDQCMDRTNLVVNGRIVTLYRIFSESGLKYNSREYGVFWNKGELATYWKNGKIIFHGVEKIDCRTKTYPFN